MAQSMRKVLLDYIAKKSHNTNRRRPTVVEPIDMDKSFKPSTELKKYIENAQQKETNMLEKQKCAMATINWL